MTAVEFAGWMQGRNLTDTAAAPLLAASRPEVSKWRRGTRPVPRRVARIVELLNQTAKVS